MNRRDAESAETEPDEELNALAGRVIGAAIAVHRVLGPGYLESVYEQALAIELEAQSVPVARQETIAVTYRGRQVGEGRVDFLVHAKLVLELKAVDRLAPIHRAQMISYLKSTGCRLGLLINFNERTLSEGI
jgi:GxxExxY protein